MPPTPQNFDFPDSLCTLLLETKPGVLLIDMQELFVVGYPEDKLYSLIQNQTRVLNLCKRYNLPYAIIEYLECGATLSELINWKELIPNVNPFIKDEDDAFTNPELQEQITKWKVRDLLFMGKNAQACVRDTAKSALGLGYKIHTAEGVIGDNNGDRGIEVARDWFRANGNYILPREQ